MVKKNEQHNPASYAELILLSADSTKNEFENQTKPDSRRMIPGMFSSISDAELITQRLLADANADEDDSL